MRMPGLNYARRSAALIPPKGVLLGAIDPANRCCLDNTQKNPANMPGMRALIF